MRRSTVSWTVRHKVHQLQPSQGKDQTIMFRGSYSQIGRRGKFKAEYPLCYDKSFAIKTKYLLQDVQWLVGSPVSSMGSTTYQVYTDLLSFDTMLQSWHESCHQYHSCGSQSSNSFFQYAEGSHGWWFFLDEFFHIFQSLYR